MHKQETQCYLHIAQPQNTWGWGLDTIPKPFCNLFPTSSPGLGGGRGWEITKIREVCSLLMVNSNKSHYTDLSSPRVKYFRRVTLNNSIIVTRLCYFNMFFCTCRAPISLCAARIGPPSPVWTRPIRVQFPPARVGRVVVDQPRMASPDPGSVPLLIPSGKRGGIRGAGSGFAGFGVCIPLELGVAQHTEITEVNYEKEIVYY